MTTVLTKAERAFCALACYPGGDPDDLAATLVDLMVDLMHLARQHDLEPDFVTYTAQDHYDADVHGIPDPDPE